jgi:hypothetical protein
MLQTADPNTSSRQLQGACAVWWKRRRNARAAFPPCCLEYQERTGTRRACPQHEQRAAANDDHLRRLQRAEVFDKLRDAFGAGAGGPERTWGYDSSMNANPDDGSTTDGGYPAKNADATSRWLREHDKTK